MMYDDNQLVNNVATLNEMAKEYAKNIEERQMEKLALPLKQLYINQKKAQFCYNSLLKFAKQNAMGFMKELLKNCTVNLEKINKIITSESNSEVINEATNNYVKLFKNALSYEINSLKYCILCQNVCKNDVNNAILSEILSCCENHIEKLIACF